MYESYNYGFYKVRLYFDAVHDLKYFYVFVTEPEAYIVLENQKENSFQKNLLFNKTLMLILTLKSL